jgi:hypothetical protein
MDDLCLELDNFVWISKTDEGLLQNDVKNKNLNFL